MIRFLGIQNPLINILVEPVQETILVKELVDSLIVGKHGLHIHLFIQIRMLINLFDSSKERIIILIIVPIEKGLRIEIDFNSWASPIDRNGFST
jgi:hypothetical protein